MFLLCKNVVQIASLIIVDTVVLLFFAIVLILFNVSLSSTRLMRVVSAFFIAIKLHLLSTYYYIICFVPVNIFFRKFSYRVRARFNVRVRGYHLSLFFPDDMERLTGALIFNWCWMRSPRDISRQACLYRVFADNLLIISMVCSCVGCSPLTIFLIMSKVWSCAVYSPITIAL